MSALIEQLRQICGAPHVMTPADGADLSAWEQDWRKRARGKARSKPMPWRSNARRPAWATVWPS